MYASCTCMCMNVSGGVLVGGGGVKGGPWLGLQDVSLGVKRLVGQNVLPQLTHDGGIQ